MGTRLISRAVRLALAWCRAVPVYRIPNNQSRRGTVPYGAVDDAEASAVRVVLRSGVQIAGRR